MKTDILSRKDQVDTMDDNRDIKLLKDELWMRQMKIEAKVMIIRKSQVVEETTLLDEIRSNQTREQKVQKELEKNEGQV